MRRKAVATTDISICGTRSTDKYETAIGGLLYYFAFIDIGSAIGFLPLNGGLRDDRYT
jgi:hypothetical protein